MVAAVKLMLNSELYLEHPEKVLIQLRRSVQIPVSVIKYIDLRFHLMLHQIFGYTQPKLFVLVH